MKNLATWKPALSPFIAVAFAILSVTGGLLFFRVKNGAIVTFHEWFGWLFVVAGSFHSLINFKLLRSYLSLRKGVLSLLGALILIPVIGTLGGSGHCPKHKWENSGTPSCRKAKH